LAQSTSAPDIHSTSSEVVVDFVARDRQGRIVRDLRPEELRVFENDIPQQIRALSFSDSGAPPQVEQAEPAAVGTPQKAGVDRKWQELHSLVVVTAFFAGPYDALSDAGARARDLMRDVLTSEMHADTLVGIFALDSGELGTILPYTNDAAGVGPAMVAAVERLTRRKVRGSLGGPPQGPVGTQRATLSPALQAAVDRVIARLMSPKMPEDVISSDAARSESQLLALLRLVQAQAEFPGRKLLFYIGPGLNVSAQFTEIYRAVVGAANRAGVTICGVDLIPLAYGALTTELSAARGMLNNAAQSSQAERLARSDQPVTRARVMAMETAERSLHADPTLNLEILAKETGGQFIGRTNDLRTPLQRELENARSHWELTYAPRDLREDGRFRSLKVVVSRPGVTVTERSGYYALPMLDGERIVLFEYAPLMALNRQPKPADFEFRAAALRFRPGPVVQHAVVLEAALRDVAVEKEQTPGGGAATNAGPRAPTAKFSAHLSFFAWVKDADGHVVAHFGRDKVYRAAREPTLRNTPATLTVPVLLPPGRYLLEGAVVDRNSGKASVSGTRFEVGGSDGLALSSLVFVNHLEPASGTTADLDPMVVLTGRVVPELIPRAYVGTELGFYAIAYPDTRVQMPLDIRVELLRNGELGWELAAGRSYHPVQDPTGAQRVLAAFPSKDLLPGPYEARITVTQGETSRQQTVQFTLID
jgi:VWFA-related protein